MKTAPRAEGPSAHIVRASINCLISLIALAGLIGAQCLQMPELDALASIGIALVLAVAAFLLARETKGLLIGEPAHPELGEALLQLAAADPDIERYPRFKRHDDMAAIAIHF